jgi:NCAIR mutase (PurE)-related protein
MRAAMTDRSAPQNPQDNPLMDGLANCMDNESLRMESVGDHGQLDLGRIARRGLPEAIFAQGKTTKQVVELALALHRAGQTVLATRLNPDQLSALSSALPDGHADEIGRVFSLQSPEPSLREKALLKARIPPVLVVCAGTADLPVAQEALVCLKAWRVPCNLIHDVGVAGLQRLIRVIPQLQQASVIIAVAGMEATLPTAIAGLVACPVIAVPTSVGYGAHLGGIAALLSMLNSCAGGITVTNIDNGFGAAMAAALILHQIAAVAPIPQSSPTQEALP